MNTRRRSMATAKFVLKDGTATQEFEGLLSAGAAVGYDLSEARRVDVRPRWSSGGQPGAASPQVAVRVPQRVYELAKKRAKADGRTLSAFVGDHWWRRTSCRDGRSQPRQPRRVCSLGQLYRGPQSESSSASRSTSRSRSGSNTGLSVSRVPARTRKAASLSLGGLRSFRSTPVTATRRPPSFSERILVCIFPQVAAAAEAC